MHRTLAIVAVLACGAAWGAAPSYTADAVVRTTDYAPGPFAPNSVVTIFGTGLARGPQSLAATDIRNGFLPFEMNYTQVLVSNVAVPLFYVSETQVNFLVPAKQNTGPATVRVVREGQAGPEITIPVVNAAPALFVPESGYAVATHADNSLIAPDLPAHAGELIVIYATGLGTTLKNPATGEIPEYISPIAAMSDFKLSLGGVVVSAENIRYAGLTPGSAGLYQINVVLPEVLAADPELEIAVSGISSRSGAKLAYR